MASAPSGVTGPKTPVFHRPRHQRQGQIDHRPFFAPGEYTFSVNVTDASGRSTPSLVDVTVTSTLSRIDVTPKTASVKTGGKLHFLGAGAGPVRGGPGRRGGRNLGGERRKN